MPRNVDRFCSIDCESPISARMFSKTGNTASSAGTGMPACAMIASSPTVFSETVLPPVFGPLIISCRSSFEGPTGQRHNRCRHCCADVFQQADAATAFSSVGQLRSLIAEPGPYAGEILRNRARTSSVSTSASTAAPFTNDRGIRRDLARHCRERCGGSRPVRLRAAAQDRCSVRWFPAAPRYTVWPLELAP